MKKIFVILLFISANFVYSQNADLILNTAVSQNYQDYLNSELTLCGQIINNPPSDSAEMKARAKRFFINFALIHCNIVFTLDEEKALIDSLRVNNKRLEDFYKTYIASLNTDNSRVFFSELLELFKDPKYGQIKSEIESMTQNYLSALMGLGLYSINLLDGINTKMQQVSEDFALLKRNNVRFSLGVKIDGSATDQTLKINQAHFKTAGSVDSLIQNSVNAFSSMFKKLLSLQNEDTPTNEIIDSLKATVNYFSSALDTLSQLINSDPLNLLKLNTAWISDTKEFLNNTAEVLNGKVYYIGPDKIKIQPVVLLQRSLNNWRSIFFKFYKAADRYSYTFAGLFPDALPAAVVDKLKENMVLNSTDSGEELYSRMLSLKNFYLGLLAQNQGNSEIKLGAAFTQSFLYLNEIVMEINDFIDYVKASDYRHGFTFQAINNKALTDSITGYYNSACGDRELLFTVLIINEEQSQPYIIGTETDFTPVFITNPMLAQMRNIAHEFSNTINDISDYFRSIYNDMDNMFVMDLDPNYLDFSGVKSPLDIILVLEKSNPDFLDITPYGITKIQDMRTKIREKFSNYAEDISNLDNFLDSLEIYRSEFNLGDRELAWLISGLNEVVQEVNTDFQIPDSATVIHGIKVNLSAWFDNPPQDLLVKLKWFFDNDPATDNSLGGLFPDGITNTVEPGPIIIPKEYILSQNFPNPFNPSTMINYSLPKSAMVIIKVYDLLGKEVATLINDEQAPGNYTVKFNAKNLTSGIYFYRMQAGGFVSTKKLIVLK